MSGGVSVLCWIAAPVLIFYGNPLESGSKKMTNHPISINSHPSATTNNAKHSLKRGGGFTNYIILTKYGAVHPTAVSEKFLIRDADNLDNRPNNLYEHI